MSKIVLLSAIVILITISIWYAKKKDKKEKTLLEDKTLDIKEDSPVSFGYKCVWFSVKTTDNKIAEHLNLKNISYANWQLGIEKAYSTNIFISPPVEGWTFIVGWGLPDSDTEEGLLKIQSLADSLSLHYGEAQFFATHRAVEYHCWLKSVNGKTERLYSYLGEKGKNILIIGQPTDAEKDFNLINTFSAEAKLEDYFEDEELIYPDEELVMQIAEKWSINPIKLDTYKNYRGIGLLGTL